MPADTTEIRTALIVDDEEPLLQVLDEVLREAGFATTCFTRGRPALEALSHGRFDLLVLDVGLPDMNGLRIGLAARERYDDDVVILIITADDQRARSVGAYAVGADDFMGKPFDIEQLVARINARFGPAAVGTATD